MQILLLTFHAVVERAHNCWLEYLNCWHCLCIKVCWSYSVLNDQVLEVRPAIAWDKGKAVNYLLNSLGTCDSPADMHYLMKTFVAHVWQYDVVEFWTSLVEVFSSNNKLTYSLISQVLLIPMTFYLCTSEMIVPMRMLSSCWMAWSTPAAFWCQILPSQRRLLFRFGNLQRYYQRSHVVDAYSISIQVQPSHEDICYIVCEIISGAFWCQLF